MVLARHSWRGGQRSRCAPLSGIAALVAGTEHCRILGPLSCSAAGISVAAAADTQLHSFRSANARLPATEHKLVLRAGDGLLGLQEGVSSGAVHD